MSHSVEVSVILSTLLDVYGIVHFSFVNLSCFNNYMYVYIIDLLLLFVFVLLFISNFIMDRTHMFSGRAESLHCTENHFPCENYSICIPDMHTCDGVPHCPDGSDETPKACCQYLWHVLSLIANSCYALHINFRLQICGVGWHV